MNHGNVQKFPYQPTEMSCSPDPDTHSSSVHFSAHWAFQPQSCSRTISAVSTFPHTQLGAILHVHIWEIERRHILSSVSSGVPLPVSLPGGMLDSGPVHPNNFCLFPFPLLFY